MVARSWFIMIMIMIMIMVMVMDVGWCSALDSALFHADTAHLFSF